MDFCSFGSNAEGVPFVGFPFDFVGGVGWIDFPVWFYGVDPVLGFPGFVVDEADAVGCGWVDVDLWTVHPVSFSVWSGAEAGADLDAGVSCGWAGLFDLER